MSGSEVIRQLKELAELRASGAITEQEYTHLKGELLAPGGPVAPQPPSPPSAWASSATQSGAKPPGAAPPCAPQPGANAMPRFCPQCGSAPGNAPNGVCGSCGAKVGSQPRRAGWEGGGSGTAAGGSWSAIGGAGLNSARGWAESRGFTSERIAGGDWPGALIAAGSGLGAMIALTGLCVLVVAGMASGALSQLIPGLQSLGGGSSDAIVGFIPAFVTLAAGGSLSSSASSSSAASISATLDLTPLGVTLLGFAVIAFVFVRRLGGHGHLSASDVVLQAARVWAVLLASLLVLCVISRAALGVGIPTPNVIPTLFGATFWLALALWAVVVWKRPDVLPPRLRSWRHLSLGPLVGVLVTIVVFTAFALLALAVSVLVAAGQVSSSSSFGYGFGALVVVLLLMGPNLVLTLFGLALGAPVSATMSGSSPLGLLPSNLGTEINLLKMTDASGWFWLLPLFGAAAVILGGVVSALHAASPEEARRTSWRFGVALTVVLTLAAMVSSVSVSGSGSAGGLFDGGSGSGEGRFGLQTALMFFVALLWSLAGGFAAAIAAPNLPAGFNSFVRGRIPAVTQQPVSGYGTTPSFGAPPSAPAAPFPSAPPSAPAAPFPSAPPSAPAAPFPSAPPSAPAAVTPSGVAGTPWYLQTGGSASAPTPQPSTDLAAALEELTKRHAAGMLSDQEFADARTGLLRGQ